MNDNMQNFSFPLSLCAHFVLRIVAIVFQKRIVLLCAGSLENRIVIKSQ